MSPGQLDPARVSALLQQAVAELVLPWFRRLDPADIELKLTPGLAEDVVSRVEQGRKDFVVYHRILPWDHAPGALILTEAGGSVLHLDGRPYAPANLDQITICAGSERASAALRQWLREGGGERDDHPAATEGPHGVPPVQR